MFKKFRKTKPKKTEETYDTNSLTPGPPQFPGVITRTPSTGSAYVLKIPSISVPSGDGYITSSSALTPRPRSPSPDPSSRTWGLHRVYQPEGVPAIDIVFIHGLGGDCIKSWSHQRDPANFWPGTWLPLDPELSNARIFTFGYNAGFRPGDPRSVSNVSDFAKDLLYNLKFCGPETAEQCDIGSIPLVFVCHSMGGLVVKKAYLLGQNDERYKDIVSSTMSMVFLSTPHRGSNLAEVLNKVLVATFQSPKYFLNDLNRGSQTLEDINEQFRHVAQNLSLWSFYETLTTTVGPRKVMILEKDSSVLGYPGEISKPLEADHHTVCKYVSINDSSYISVLGALKSIFNAATAPPASTDQEITLEERQHIRKSLAIDEDPMDDFLMYSDMLISGTCNWFFNEQGVSQWLDPTTKSMIMLYTAPPASGKSILSTRMIKHLKDANMPCQYFFFIHNDTKKQSIASMLRALAWQIAEGNAEFRKMVSDLAKGGTRFEKSEASVIWQQLYVDSLFKIELPRPIFWVFDALDECEAPKRLLDLFRGVAASKTRIRILMTSRNTDALQSSLKRFPSSILLSHIEKQGSDHNKDDIRMLVEQEIDDMRGDEDLKRRVTESILKRAEGNFLWARLVLQEILDCHTEESIEQVLNELPNDMTQLYARIETAIINQSRGSSKSLAKAILQWTITAQRPLNIDELSHALAPEFTGIIDMKRTVLDICGQLVRVDSAGQVKIVHQTAREYLLRPRDSFLFIDTKVAHFELFKKTISVLSGPDLASGRKQASSTLHTPKPFLVYAATAWAFHLGNAGTTSNECMNMLMKLFKSMCILSWIKILALADRLDVLVRAAKVLSTFVQNTRRSNASQNPLLHRIADLEVLDQWNLDLVKVVGKFSRHLIDEPSSIYRLIPTFSPEDSIIHRQFGHSDSCIVRIMGIQQHTWNDNLAKLAMADGVEAIEIAAAGSQLFVLQSDGTILLWDTEDFLENSSLRHGEPVTCLCINKSCTKLASYGLRTTKIWDLTSGQILSATESVTEARAMTMMFADRDATLVGGFGDSTIRFLSLDTNQGKWSDAHSSLLREDSNIQGALHAAPTEIAFNHNGEMVCVAYRTSPLSVWNMEDGTCINHLQRSRSTKSDGPRPSINWFGVNKMAWNPISDHIVGLYKDGCLFKWHPFTDENDEIAISADEIAVSPNGKLFLTSSNSGTITLWSFQHFSVIYKLSSDDLVNALVFSPDSLRFYDIRAGTNSVINAWEPNALIRLSEVDDIDSDTASDILSLHSTSHASQAHLTRADVVTAIAAPEKSSFFAAGTEDGIIELKSTFIEESLQIGEFHNFMDVNRLSWSPDGTHLASSDLAGDIMLHHFTTNLVDRELPQENTIKRLTSPKLDLHQHAIHSMLWSSDAQEILIVSGDMVCIWSISTESISASITTEDDSHRRWLNHPRDPQFILAYGPKDVRIFHWTDLTEPCPARPYQSTSHHGQTTLSLTAELEKATLEEPASPIGTIGQDTRMTITGIFVTNDKQYIVMQMSQSTSSSNHRGSRPKHMIFSASSFDVPRLVGTNSNVAIPYHQITPSIAKRIHKILDIQPGGVIIFLDSDLWVYTCTFDEKAIAITNQNTTTEIDTTDSKHDLVLQVSTPRRHYFIPRDWFGKRSLSQCCMLSDGTLLYPKEDKVAVIKADFDAVRQK